MKQAVWVGMIVGGAVGGFIPTLWGGGFFAATIFSALGGFLGIWIGYKLSQ
ncbi:MAG: hypothetical protein V4437_00835 [Patescibacteria group bacterium]